MLKTFAALNIAGQRALAQGLRNLLQQFNRSGDTSLIVPGEYVEVIAVQR